MVVDPDHPSGQFAIRWDDALRLAGDFLHEEAAYDPPRWRYHDWPDDTTLISLRTNAVPLPPPADPA